MKAMFAQMYAVHSGSSPIPLLGCHHNVNFKNKV